MALLRRLGRSIHGSNKRRTCKFANQDPDHEGRFSGLRFPRESPKRVWESVNALYHYTYIYICTVAGVLKLKGYGTIAQRRQWRMRLAKKSFSSLGPKCFMKLLPLNEPQEGVLLACHLISPHLPGAQTKQQKQAHTQLDDGWPESETCNCPALSKRCIEREKERVDVKE